MLHRKLLLVDGPNAAMKYAYNTTQLTNKAMSKICLYERLNVFRKGFDFLGEPFPDDALHNGNNSVSLRNARMVKML